MRDQAIDDVTGAATDTSAGLARLGELAQLQAGWLNGDGLPPTGTALRRAREALPVLAALGIRPHLFPTEDGGVQAEWTAGDCEASITFEPGGELWGSAVNVVVGAPEADLGDLRELIGSALDGDGCKVCDNQIDAVLAVMGPVLAARDEQVARLRRALFKDEPDMVTRLRMIADQEIGASAPNLAAALNDVATRIERRAELDGFLTDEGRAKVAAFAAECDAEEAAAEPEPAPPLPPGIYGRAEMPGFRSHVGWRTDGMIGGQPCIVISTRDGTVLAEYILGPACRFVRLQPPETVTTAKPSLALTGGWGDGWSGTEEMLDDDAPGHAESLMRSDAEGAFLAASVAVWRQIDRLDADPEGYHPARMSVDLRLAERAAWESYRDSIGGSS